MAEVFQVGLGLLVATQARRPTDLPFLHEALPLAHVCKLLMRSCLLTFQTYSSTILVLAAHFTEHHHEYSQPRSGYNEAAADQATADESDCAFRPRLLDLRCGMLDAGSNDQGWEFWRTDRLLLRVGML